MRTILGCSFAAVLILGAPHALAQPVHGCPAGQAMQSFDPSGRNIACVALPDVSALGVRIDAAAAEPNIVGRWAMTGTATCTQSSTGFDANFNPNLAAGQTTVSQLTGTVNAVRTFNADGTGTVVGITHNIAHPQSIYRPGSAPSVGGAGNATLNRLDTTFTWQLQADGTLLIDDNNLIPQVFILPAGRAGWTVVIHDVPSFVGHISKDRRTITLTHNTMQVETGQLTDTTTGTTFAPSPRFCARERTLTRLSD